jgi:hypothetical protein
MECLRGDDIPGAPEVVVYAVYLDKTMRPSIGDVDIHVGLDCGKLAYVG